MTEVIAIFTYYRIEVIFKLKTSSSLILSRHRFQYKRSQIGRVGKKEKRNETEKDNREKRRPAHKTQFGGISVVKN